MDQTIPLGTAVSLGAEKLINPDLFSEFHFSPGGKTTVLIVLAAGRGSRFGEQPKCAHPVEGKPLARHSIDSFRQFAGENAPVIAIVHHCREAVCRALGDKVGFIESENPVGGTALASFEAFCTPGLLEADPLLLITMGDRIIPPSIFHRALALAERDHDSARPSLTLLTAEYPSPRHRGKGRIVRDDEGRVQRIIEQRDIDSLSHPVEIKLLDDLTEANCPFYAVRASLLFKGLAQLSCDNAQNQYYFTDMVEYIQRQNGEVRALKATAADPEYDILCADVTRPDDIPRLEAALRAGSEAVTRHRQEMERAVQSILEYRPLVQVKAIAHQLEALFRLGSAGGTLFSPHQPVSVGISGGRLRIAFMHPDMVRFYGPAWQMPIGAGTPEGREQIVVLAQTSEDGSIHLHPTEPGFRERLESLSAEAEYLYPGVEVSNWHAFESFGTRMAEQLLLSLGYFSEKEVRDREVNGSPLPPPALWVPNGMRRPFSLLGNALASIRTLRRGAVGERIQTFLGRDSFRGIRIASTGEVPQGGFSSSSAVTLAVKNAVNALYQLGIEEDTLIDLACQAEYGTGVRAGSLDQATEQKGRPGEGALLSSNPKEHYRILGNFPVPSDRFKVIFPYSVDRDREAWHWSGGFFGSNSSSDRPTTAEVRKLTGKAAEIAAILLRLPLDEDFFPMVQDDLIDRGRFSAATARDVAQLLRALPLFITREELREQLQAARPWLQAEYSRLDASDPDHGFTDLDGTLESLLSGWRDPQFPFPSTAASGPTGVPLRSMVAYLFGEVAKNFHLIRHPSEWIDCVTRSQGGDRCFSIDLTRLPPPAELLDLAEWEKGCCGPDRLDLWLERLDAQPVDFNSGLTDQDLEPDAPPPVFETLKGGNFFRGLALIDLAEAFLKHAFGDSAVAVRVNAAGQGDFFQVHIDTRQVSPETVKAFIRRALYDRFGIQARPDFVEPSTGGPAKGIRLSRFDHLPELISRLRKAAG